MKSASHVKISGHSLLGFGVLFAVLGIVLSLAGVPQIGGVIVCLGVILAGTAALRFGNLTIW